MLDNQAVRRLPMYLLTVKHARFPGSKWIEMIEKPRIKIGFFCNGYSV